LLETERVWSILMVVLQMEQLVSEVFRVPTFYLLLQAPMCMRLTEGWCRGRVM